MSAPILHATLIAARRGGRWCGALLQGASGVGKSDLALRATAAGWRLVADDRVRVWASTGALYGAAPPRLAGLMEVRGLGVVSQTGLPFSRIRLVVRGRALAAPLERTPDAAHLTLCNVDLPCVDLALCEACALAKLDRALERAIRCGGGQFPPHGAAGDHGPL